MTDQTIVAMFDTVAHAEAAVASLKSAGVPADAIGMHAESTGTSANVTTASPVREEGFWANLFGGAPDHDTAVYDRSLASGSTVVSVNVPDEHASKVTDILESHNPVDIDERAASYGLTQATTGMAGQPATSGTLAAAPAASNRTDDASMLQLSKEELAVGKRVVNHGGTRIRRYVVETPIEENVALHSEKVVMERHPVSDNRVPAGSFTDKTIEMTETSEEAVVSKTAHVYEEVGLRKEVSDRVETVRDTVRKEEVEVEQVPGSTNAGSGEPATTGTANTTNNRPPKI